MIWKFINTGYNDGKFNMDFDLELVKNFSGVPLLRVYRWEPYCISFGANQQPNSIDQEKTLSAGFDIVKRPTGGRAILHAEELTYSVVYPISVENTPKLIYREINLALLNGLVNFNPALNKIQLEHTQPHFQSFYKDTKSTLCFAVSAMNELNYDGKKVVGSAQRKLGDIILQHGSILCGAFHKRIIDYLDLHSEKVEEIKNEIDQTTTELETILGEKINYDQLVQAIKKGFENHFNTMFEEEIFSETILQVN
jgi:lipoate-protein ligase A